MKLEDFTFLAFVVGFICVMMVFVLMKNKIIRTWLTFLFGIATLCAETFYLMFSRIGVEMVTNPNFATISFFSLPLIVSIIYLSLLMTEIVTGGNNHE